MIFSEDRPVAKEDTVEFDQDSLSYKCVKCGADIDGPGECRFCGSSYTLSLDSTLITYTCSSCQASLVSSTKGLSQCRFCGVDYGSKAFDSSTKYARVTPQFPRRGFGGESRDNDKEKDYEADFIDKLKKFHGEGSKDKEDFLHIFLQTVYRMNIHNVSLTNSFDPAESIMGFIENESYEKTEEKAKERYGQGVGNQSNIVRALPEIISNENFWGNFKNEAITQGKQELYDLRTELEFAFGFLVPYDSENVPEGSEQMTKSEVREEYGEKFPPNNEKVIGRLRNMFRFGRKKV
jgi:hypothetical protein